MERFFGVGIGRRRRDGTGGDKYDGFLGRGGVVEDVDVDGDVKEVTDGLDFDSAAPGLGAFHTVGVFGNIGGEMDVFSGKHGEDFGEFHRVEIGGVGLEIFGNHFSHLLRGAVFGEKGDGVE